MKKIIVILIIVSIFILNAQIFTEVETGLAGTSDGSVSWGDFDNDNLLDVIVTGSGISKIYHNNNDGTFTDIEAGLTGVSASSVAWGDYNNDNFSDILITGLSASGNISKIYKNNGNSTFSDINAGLTGVAFGSAVWCDFENDGFLDILLTGNLMESQFPPGYEIPVSKIYKNNGNGTFTDINAGLTGVSSSFVSCNDYDNDGYTDFILTGLSEWNIYGSAIPISKIYKNNSDGTFTAINAGLTGVMYGSASWGDYDNDGYDDILITGFSSGMSLSETISKIYHNNGNGTFTDIDAGLQSVEGSSTDWGDYDNDGNTDILLTGGGYLEGSFSDISLIYHNNGDGTFSVINAGILDVFSGSVEWGDYDNDGKLDILIAGRNQSKIYKNNSIVANTEPLKPENPSTVINGNDVILSWDRSTDSETPQNGLSYNIYMGNSPQSTEAVSPMSDLSYGYRNIVSAGNSGKINSKTISWLPTGTYYWGVQAIDNAYSGSEFSVGEEFFYSSPLPVTPIASEATNVHYYSFTANWDDTGDKGYELDVATDSLFTNILPDYDRKKVFSGYYCNISGLEEYHDYFYRIRSFNGDNISSENSNVIKVRTTYPPFTEIEYDFPELVHYTVDWGDYNNDGNLDIVMSGKSRIYRSNGDGSFTINAGLPELTGSSAAWGDYNNDGFLDIVLTGYTGSEYFSGVFHNNGDDTFTEISAELTGVNGGSVAWDDYNNDGLLDLLITGYYATGNYISVIYRNNGDGTFTDINAGLQGVTSGDAEWGDYDNDGDPDLILTGWSPDLYPDYRISKIYRNDGYDIFTEIYSGLPGISSGSVAWGDYNCDGLLDIALSGDSNSGRLTRIYRNNGDDTFSDINADIINVRFSDVSWADYDNDGYPDLFISGQSQVEGVAKVYRYEGNDVFTDIKADFRNFYDTNSAWGDFNNDNSLDLIVCGTNDSNRVQIYQNDIKKPNTVPSIPVNLSAGVSGQNIQLSWDKASDPETNQEALSYNVYIGTSSTTADVLNPMSDLSTGKRTVVDGGNAGMMNSYDIKWLPSGNYFWGIQTIDKGFLASAFSSESTIDYTAPLPSIPVAEEATEIDHYGFKANWISTGDKYYLVDVSADSLFTSLETGYENHQVFSSSYLTVTGLEQDSTYYYRVRSRNADGAISDYSNTVKVGTTFPAFSEISTLLPDTLALGDAEWADYDNDGDLDILITGATESYPDYNQVSRIYRNDAGIFTDINAGLRGVMYSSVLWADFDNDGDLDIGITGRDQATDRVTKLYRNDSGVFTDMNCGLPGVSFGSITGSDYDNDGDIDLLITGYSTGAMTKLFENDNGIFSEVNVGLPQMQYCTADWADFDNDGDNDLALGGRLLIGNLYTPTTNIYRNDNGILTDISAGLEGIESGSLSWGDFNNDSYPDILLTGAYKSRIYRNNTDGTFSDISVDLQGLAYSSSAWGDYNCDGYLDVLISGEIGNGIYYTGVYRNNGNETFSKENVEIINVNYGAVAWGDYNCDGKLDFYISGNNYPDRLARLYKNDSKETNHAPAAPTNLISGVNAEGITLSWDRASDAETPQNGLSYNIYLGKVSGTGDLISPLCDINTGYRRVVKIGNAGQSKFWTINDFSGGTYYWSVQAVDHCFAGSVFAPEQTFTITGIEDEVVPLATELYQNYPNPFNPVTVINYSLAKNAQVKLTVFDIAGREVISLVDQEQDKGWYEAKLNGDKLTSGIYFFRLSVDGKPVQSRKMMMLK